MKELRGRLVLLLFALVSCRDAGPTEPEFDDPPFTGWQAENSPELSPYSFWRSWAVGKDAAYAYDGQKLFQFDGVKWSWAADVVGVTSMGGSDRENVFLGAGRGMVYRWNGRTLAPLPATGLTEAIVAVWATSPTEVYAVESWTRRILRFDGTSWNDIGWPDTQTRANFFLSGHGSNHLIAAMYREAFRWDGTRWHTMGTPFRSGISGLWMTGPNHAIAVGGFSVDQAGEIAEFDGTTWRMMEIPTVGSLWGVWGSARDRIFAVGSGGTILHYDGRRWQQMESGTKEDLRSVMGSGERVFVTGNSGLILTLENGRWKKVHYAPALTSVWGQSPQVVFAVGADGTILRREGRTWRRDPTPTIETLRGIWGSSRTNVLAVGDSGTILRYDGARWSLVPSGTTANLRAVWGRSPTEVYAAGDRGTLLKFDGSRWVALSTGVTLPLFSITDRSATEVIVGGARSLLTYDGIRVRPVPATDAAFSTYAALARRDGAVLAGGSMYRPEWRYSAGFLGSLVGDEWRALPFSGFVTGLWSASSTTAYAIDSQRVFRIDGDVVTPVDTGRPHWSVRFHGIWGISPTELFAVGEGSLILHGRL